jgi:two-component system sensor histidine kinase KdpD
MVATGTLEERWRHLRDDARDELIVTARQQTAHLASYVTNLLEISRIEAGAVGPRLDAVMLPDLLDDVLDTMRLRLNHHRLVLDLPDDLPPLAADATLLRQTLVNILDNAVKYAPRGSLIRIVADPAREAIADAAGQTAALRIIDQGPGVPEADLARLFQKFFRAANASQPGTGLGLTICRGLVTAMGGTIDATNRPGGGLCIRLSLPACPSPGMPSDFGSRLAAAET